MSVARVAAVAVPILATGAAAALGWPVWPLPDWPLARVQGFGPRSARGFGASRSTAPPHVHAGVDLGPPRSGTLGRAAGSVVRSPLSGHVGKVGGWRQGTRRVEIHTTAGLIVLGALDPAGLVKEGAWVRRGQPIGYLGQYPGGSSMLHLERWVLRRGRWVPGESQPRGLIDPTRWISRAVRL